MSEIKNATTEEIQKNLLVIFKMIKKIFDENKVHYFLIYGTLLGAVRHKGFIPWDDDIDICVEKKHYERAMSLLREKLPDYLIVHDKKKDPKYWLPYSQIVYTFSSSINTQWPENNSHPWTGIGVDIFRYWEEKKYSKYSPKLIATQLFLQNLFSNRTSYRMLGKTLRIIKYSFLYFVYTIKHLFSKKNKMYCMDPISLSKPMLPEVLENSTVLDFENLKCTVPQDYDTCLKTEFGDYMTLPPEEERETHYSICEISKNIYEMENYENYI